MNFSKMSSFSWNLPRLPTHIMEVHRSVAKKRKKQNKTEREKEKKNNKQKETGNCKPANPEKHCSPYLEMAVSVNYFSQHGIIFPLQGRAAGYGVGVASPYNQNTYSIPSGYSEKAAQRMVGSGRDSRTE